MAMGQSALRVSSSGNIGINENNPSEKLEITGGAIRVDGLTTKNQQFVADVEDSNVGFYLRTRDGGSNSGDYGIFQLRGGSGDIVMSVRDVSMARWNEAFNYNYVNRALNVSGTIASFGSILTSDKKAKTKIKPLKYGLKSVLDLEPVHYEYNGAYGSSEGEAHIGVLAQNLQEVVPELVVNKAYNENDEDYEKINEQSYLAIKDNEVKWLLVNAIKEQQTIIENLQSQIDEISQILTNANFNEEIKSIEINNNQNNTLGQNSPNPYDSQTIIEYNIVRNVGDAKIKFFNLSGQLIKTVNLQEGNGKVKISSEELLPGTYTYSLEVDGVVVETKKMVKMH